MGTIRRTLIDNSLEGYTMAQMLQRCLEDKNITHVDIATGFWDLRGTKLIFEQIKAFLNREGSKLRLLLGKDPYLYRGDIASLEEKPYKKQEDGLLVEMNDFEANPEYVEIVQLLVDSLNDENKKFEIKVYKPDGELKDQFLHSKCYIFYGKDEDRRNVAYGIIGSSNLTKQGFEGNSELNVLEDNPNDIITINTESRDKTHLQWFNEKWELGQDWNQEFLLQVQSSKIAPKIINIQPAEEEQDPNLTPYELYIKLLQIKFGRIVDKELGQQIENYLPKRYDRYVYQIDAVKQCYSTMKEHGGFLLADVVGLGKTIVGALLIKHFLQNPDEDGREQKILIITPPAIQSAWKNTIKEFDNDSDFKLAPFIDYITTGSIGKLISEEEDLDEDSRDTGDFEGHLKQNNYGLILIDESHKFRNSETAMYKSLNNLIAQIGSEIGAYPYVGLLSATPQNNRPIDLQNQIYLFERNHSSSTLKKAKGGNIESFFAEINKEYADVIHPKADDDGIMPTKEALNRKLKNLSYRIRECILSDVMVRRTRTDVLKYYKEDIDNQGITFPTIEGPISLEYKMSKTLSKLFYDSMMSIAPNENSSNGLMYYRYRAIQYFVSQENKKKYEARGSRDADVLAEQLANIMQMNLVKRLESSFSAFKQSLLNLRDYTKNMIDMWENDAIFICPQFNVNYELDRKKKELKRGHKVSLAECFEDIRKRITKLNEEGRNEDQSNMEYHRSDFRPEYIDLLREDYSIISELCDRWGQNSEDPKFDEFKENLRFTLFNKDTNRPQKLVIFTESIDTADSIEKAASSKGYSVLKITASNRHELEKTIQENFDANYKGEWKNDYEVIVTTDVLAEGINLHRANCILNYDTPWNSTRLMQRIGRVNRIGSSEDKVYVYNFMPSAEGDKEIKLVQKAHAKLQSFHTIFGEDSQIFSNNEDIAHYDLNTQVNGEESPLEKYVYELKQYKEQNPKRYSFIEKKEDGLDVASSMSGDCFFLVKTPKMSGMFVKVAHEQEEGEILSLIDGISSFKVTPDVIATELPDNWMELRNEAERTVLAELSSIRLMKSNSQKATDAKGKIIDLKNRPQTSAESKKLLNAADRLIRQGNSDIINIILRIAKAIEEKDLLLPFTEEDFNQYLSDAMSIIVSNAQARQGKPQVILGTCK